MKKIYIRLFIICNFSLLYISVFPRSALTFPNNGGRVGDALLNYAKHLYLAQKNDLDLYRVKGFPYYAQYVLSDETPEIDLKDHTYKTTITLRSDADIVPGQDDTLYIGNYYMPFEDVLNFDLCFDPMFKHSVELEPFSTNVRKRLLPKQLPEVNLPCNVTTVAMHIRKGGGHDNPLGSEQYRPAQQQEGPGERTDYRKYADRDKPFKFPPEQYYVDQLMFLHEILDHQPIYVYVFTDDRDPEALVNRVKEHMNTTNITFDYRASDNAHNKNVAEDLYTMSRFDYLIKSGSHYPWISQVIGNHKAILSPTAYEWQADYLCMTEVKCYIPDRINHILHAVSADSDSINQIKQLLFEKS